MFSKLPEQKKNELTPPSKVRKKLLQDNFVEDPDLSKPYVIIEHNLDIIESLQKLLIEVVEMSSEGIKKESLDDKNQIFNKIRETITRETQYD